MKQEKKTKFKLNAGVVAQCPPEKNAIREKASNAMMTGGYSNGAVSNRRNTYLIPHIRKCCARVSAGRCSSHPTRLA